VLSFAEATGLPQDATAYKNNPSASTAELTPASLIAGGVKFSGKESITCRQPRRCACCRIRVSRHPRGCASKHRSRLCVFALTDGAKSMELDVAGAKLVVARAAMGGAR
jgi:hypothetical protein